VSIETKYVHPENPELAWTGKGRQPKWVEFYLANGGALEQLEVAAKPAAGVDGDVIDLGIGEPPVTLGTKLYAQRIVAGAAEVPAVVDRELQQAIDTERQAQSLVRMDADNGGDPVAMLVAAHSDAAQSHLDVCLREFGFVSMTADEFLQAGIDELNQSVIRACRAGTAFWAAQEALGKTECADGALVNFKDWIAQAGLTKERVYECIRLAKFYGRLPNDKRSQLLTMGKKPALLLASLPQEVIDQSAESGNDLIDKADMMTAAELKEEIRRLERIAKNLDADIERKDSQIKRLSQAKVRTTEFLIRTEEIREESMALQLGAELSLNSLKKLFADTDAAAPEGILQQETLWITATTILARALDLVEHMHDFGSPEAQPDRPQHRHLLTPDEAVRWLQDYPLIENRFAAEQALRQEKRDAAKPKGPGRPKGAANKGAEE